MILKVARLRLLHEQRLRQTGMSAWPEWPCRASVQLYFYCYFFLLFGNLQCDKKVNAESKDCDILEIWVKCLWNWRFFKKKFGLVLKKIKKIHLAKLYLAIGFRKPPRRCFLLIFFKVYLCSSCVYMKSWTTMQINNCGNVKMKASLSSSFAGDSAGLVFSS